MLLERTSGARAPSSSSSSSSKSPSTHTDEQPLTCMIYFFASQMKRNSSLWRPSPPPQQEQPPPPTHPLDKLLSTVGRHAAFSPLVTKFEAVPVDNPEADGFRKKTTPATAHDTLLLMKFRSKRAREEWIATREWREFMEGTERERVFRRIPHVRCARSLKGLGDPAEVLGV